MTLQNQSCRIAFAALLHDLGKFAERAAPDAPQARLDAHVTNYCKWHASGGGGYHSHRHAAWTALFMDDVEKSARFDPLIASLRFHAPTRLPVMLHPSRHESLSHKPEDLKPCP